VQKEKKNTKKKKLKICYVGLEVLTAVFMKSSSHGIQWMTCNPLKINRSFGGRCRFYLQD
jgi:hypothetical protein